MEAKEFFKKRHAGIEPERLNFIDGNTVVADMELYGAEVLYVVNNCHHEYVQTDASWKKCVRCGLVYPVM